MTTTHDVIGQSWVTWEPLRPVQTCSLCTLHIYRQAGGWPLTERPSCLLLFLFLFKNFGGHYFFLWDYWLSARTFKIPMLACFVACMH